MSYSLCNIDHFVWGQKYRTLAKYNDANPKKIAVPPERHI